MNISYYATDIEVYPIQLIHIYIYIYIYMNFMCFVYCNIVATHTHDGHTGFTFK